MIAQRAIGGQKYPKRTTSLRARVAPRRLRIPDELLILVLSFLKLGDLLNCRIVSRHFFDLIKNSLALQYRIELAHAALEELYQPITVIVDPQRTIERLDLLRKQQFGWRNLAWRARHLISLDHEKGALCELSSGIFVMGKRRKPGIPRSRALVLQELPTLDTNLRPSKAEIECHVDISQVCFDIEQDLLVLLEEVRKDGFTRRDSPITFRLHLKSLSSHTPHPKPLIPILEYDCDSQWSSYSYVVQIMGNSLGALFTSGVLGDSDYERFIVWDWTTGVKRGMVSMPNSRYDSFTFISPDTFVIPCGRTETINVFQFRPTPPPNHPDRGPAIHHLCALKLPALNPTSGYKYLTITCQSQPTPFTPMYYESPNVLPRPKKLFTPDQSDGIVQFSVSLSQGPRTVELLIVMHRRALMSFVTSSQDDLGDPLTQPWETYPMMPAKTWGPDIIFPVWRAISRCMICPFPNPLHTRWRSQVFGHRMVQFVPTTLRAGSIRVMDFNPLFIKRPPLFPEDYHSVIQSTVTRRIVSDVGVIAKGDIFAEDIQSGLPYYEVTTKEAFPLSGILLDDERIIGLKVGSPGSHDIVALDVFVI